MMNYGIVEALLYHNLRLSSFRESWKCLFMNPEGLLRFAHPKICTSSYDSIVGVWNFLEKATSMCDYIPNCLLDSRYIHMIQLQFFLEMVLICSWKLFYVKSFRFMTLKMYLWNSPAPLFAPLMFAKYKPLCFSMLSQWHSML